MKKFKIVSNVMVILAATLFGLGVVVSVLAASPEEAIFLALVQLNATIFACAGIGVFLMFAKNDAARKTGNGLTVVAFLTGLVCALITLLTVAEANDDVSADAVATPYETGVSIGAIFVIVAVVFLLLRYAFLLVDYLVNRNSAETGSPNDDVRIVRVREWKQLMEEGIITEEEFEEKRVELLGLKPKIEEIEKTDE